MNLKHLFKQPLQRVPNSTAILLLVVALLGFADAGYLTVEHYQNAIPPCSITGGCETVLTSAYATVLGIPISLVGSIFYLVVLVGVVAFLESKQTKLLKWALLLTVLAFVSSLWLIYLQVFVLHAICAYCMGSAITSIILFVIAMHVFSRYQTA
jgi:uncharacterized membrane protein